MGTQPVRQAINLGEAEMAGGLCLFTVTGTVTLGFHASLDSCVLGFCFPELNATTYPEGYLTFNITIVLGRWSA